MALLLRIPDQRITAPELAGLCPAPAEGTLPEGLAPLPLLALLWECGRLGPGQIQIFTP